MLRHFNSPVKPRAVTSHSRKFLTGVVLMLLPLCGVWAQSTDLTERWALCEPDELAREIVPATANPPPISEQPLQAEATQLDSFPAESRLEGDARLSRGDQRLRADRIILDRQDNRARADNGFVYGDPRQAVRGKQAEVDLNNETGWFKDVDYYRPERNAQGSAREVRVNQNQQQSQLQDATYSTCPRGKEMWQLRADEINLNEATGRGTATDIVLAFKNTPVFYFPYLSFPINDQRQSGFLFPRQGYDSQSGMDLQIPYYWNIAPNRDMTITPRIMTERGILLGLEYRFLESWHQGKVGLEYLPDDRRYENSRGSFNVSDRAAPLPNLYTDLRFEYVSDDDYLRDLSNNLDFLTVNYLERHLDSRYYGNGWQALARVQGYQILNPALFAVSGKPYQRLPQLLFTGAWPTSGSGLNYQLYSEAVHFQQTDLVTGARLDVWPTLGWNYQPSWGFIKPEAGVRYTGYQLSDTAPDAKDSLSRTTPTFSLDSGLIFERALHADWLGVSAGTQTLEPRLFYLYVPYRNQNDIPLFDSALMDRDPDWLFRRNRFVGADRMGDANQLTAAVTTRVIDGSSGRERLRASIGQIQYFEDRRVTLTPDDPPETASSSGLIAQGQVNLSSRWAVQGGVQLEPDNNEVLRGAVDVRYYANPRQLLNVSYLMDRDQPDFDLNDQVHSVDISLFWPLSSQWRTMARWNQSLNTERNLETLAGLEYEDCCWALRMVARQHRDSPADPDSQTAFYVELELKGLSRLGSGLETLLQSSIVGYQPIRY